MKPLPSGARAGGLGLRTAPGSEIGRSIDVLQFTAMSSTAESVSVHMSAVCKSDSARILFDSAVE